MDFGVKEIGSLTICGECDNMYSGMPGPDHMLPCGHKASQTIFVASCIRDALAAQDMIDWLMDNGLLHENARELVEEAGGRLDNGLNLKVPSRNLTDDEILDL
ncbi:MAG TPA: hypothetical protein H9991_05940 [Candidatus Mailhella excrementigallinarum]|nr:hypothetical protein [Candidatus Mailhella excrementigallinarum]